MLTQTEMQGLLTDPTEGLSIEYKSWLDFGTRADQAVLAKAAIALTNTGGGVIVLGVQEDRGDGRRLNSFPRPDGLSRYTQDDINAAINRYIDPKIHCEVGFARSPQTNHEHCFVFVPGGLTVPAMCVKACDGVLAAQKCYIRKPGPKSEEPFTAEEWRGVLERCLAARRETMLDAIRTIVHGHGTLVPLEVPDERLKKHEIESRKRWNQLIGPLSFNDDARMQLGRYEVSFQVRGVDPAKTLTDLRERMSIASRVKHTGWSPFVQVTRSEWVPSLFKDTLEAWTGKPVENSFSRDPAHCNFWSATKDGLFFQVRGLDEDSSKRYEAGKYIDVRLSIWRIGELFLYAARIARMFGRNPELLFHCCYTGVKGRKLGEDDAAIIDDHFEMQTITHAVEIDDNLVEILHAFLAPFFERFGFFRLPIELVRAQVTELRSSRV